MAAALHCGNIVGHSCPVIKHTQFAQLYALPPSFSIHHATLDIVLVGNAPTNVAVDLDTIPDVRRRHTWSYE